MNCRALRVVLQAIQCKPFIVELAVQVIVMCFGSPVPLLTSMNLAHFVFTYERRQLCYCCSFFLKLLHSYASVVAVAQHSWGLETLEVKANELVGRHDKWPLVPFPIWRNNKDVYFQGLFPCFPLRSGGCVVPNGGKDVCELKHVVFDRCFRSHIS